MLKLSADQQQNDQELLQIRHPFKHQRSKGYEGYGDRKSYGDSALNYRISRLAGAPDPRFNEQSLPKTARRQTRTNRIRAMRKLPVVPICHGSQLLLIPPNHKHHRRCPASMKRGVTANRQTWVRDAMDAGGVGARMARGRTMPMRTAKSCGPGA
jgi:hypothetical protein